MITIALPAAERRVLARSFWIALSALAAAPWLALAAATRSATLLAVGVVLALLIISVATAGPRLSWRVYRGWNARIARPLGRFASRVVMRLCYLVIVVAARAGSRLPNTSPGSAA